LFWPAGSCIVMKCELCNDQEATIHLTQVVDGVVKKVHLCEKCAAQSGFDVQGPMSITDILLGMGGEVPEPLPAVKATERSCPRCHLRRVDFKKTGRLGCPACYDAFEDQLTPLLRVMHRQERHKGKIPEREKERVQSTNELKALQEQLKQAIAEEKYEEAAHIRDRIQGVCRAEKRKKSAS